MPEWYLAIAALALLAGLGFSWRPLFLALPLFVLALAAPLAQAVQSAASASFTGDPCSRSARLRLYTLTAGLHLLQPLARLRGRLRHGLTLWRRRGASGPALPRPRMWTVWNEVWRAPDVWLEDLESRLRSAGAVVMRGHDFDRWDLHVRGGFLAGARLRVAVEEHGGGRQLGRIASWPRWHAGAIVLGVILVLLSLGAGLQHAWAACAVLGLAAVILAGRAVLDAAAATGAVAGAIGVEP